MLKKFNFHIKIVFILLLILAFGLLFGGKLAHSASVSQSGVYNPYNEPDEDFDPGFNFDDDCYCDDDDDNNDDEPDATTRSASSIGETTATLNARVDGNGSSTRVWFEYGRDRDLDDETSDRSIGSGTDTVSIRISGLRRDTTYYFRVVARNSEGTDYGNILSFRTDEDDNNDNDDEDNDDNSSVPSTRTEVANFITGNSAQLNSFIRDSETNETNTWFEWGTNINLGNKTEKVLVDASPSFTHRATIVGLTPGVTYYFRAVAENEKWRSNGSILSFRTPGGASNYNPGTVKPPKTGEENPTPAEKPTETPTETKEEETTGNKSGLVANVLGFDFFPSTLLGWLLFIILILTIYVLSRRYIYPPKHTETLMIDSHGHH